MGYTVHGWKHQGLVRLCKLNAMTDAEDCQAQRHRHTTLSTDTQNREENCQHN